MHRRCRTLLLSRNPRGVKKKAATSPAQICLVRHFVVYAQATVFHGLTVVGERVVEVGEFGRENVDKRLADPPGEGRGAESWEVREGEGGRREPGMEFERGKGRGSTAGGGVGWGDGVWGGLGTGCGTVCGRSGWRRFTFS